MAVVKFRASQIANASAEDGLKSAQFNDAELATAKLADGLKFIKNDGTVAHTADQSMGTHKITNLSDGVADTDATSLGQVKTLLTNAGAASEWQNSCGTLGITVPGSPVSGDRVFIIQSYVAATGVITLGTPAGAFTGKAGQIATWNGSAWTFSVPTTGTYVSVDTETSGFFFYSGTWAFKQFEASTTGNGLTKTGNAITVNADGATLDGSAAALKVKDAGITATQLAASVAGAGLTGGAGTALAVGSGNGITVAADAISVNTDGATLDGTAAALKVKDAGITATQLAASVAGAGLTGGAGTALAVGSGNGITVAADAISVNTDGATLDGSAAALKVKDAGITATQLAASVAGNGLTGGAGTALAVGSGTGITVAADAISVDNTVVCTFANYKTNRQPAETPNAARVVFTFPETPKAGTEQIFVSGQLLEPGAGNDYTIAGAVVTMAIAPITTDKVRGYYFV
jgi:hypothetical protein